MYIYKDIGIMYTTIAINEKTNTLLNTLIQDIKFKRGLDKLSKNSIIFEGLELLRKKEENNLITEG